MHRTQEKYLRMHACENILLEIPCFKSVNFQKNYFSIASLSEENREISFHMARYVAEKIKKHLTGCCHGLLVADWITRWSPNFWYTKISRRRGLTAPYLEFANYSCTNIAIYNFSFGVILKSRLLSYIEIFLDLKVYFSLVRCKINNVIALHSTNQITGIYAPWWLLLKTRNKGP